MPWRQSIRRPTMITVSSVLSIIGGILMLLIYPWIIAMIIFYNPLLGVIYTLFLALGVYYIIAGYAMYKGKGWAWTHMVIAMIIGFLINIPSIIMNFNAVIQAGLVGLASTVASFIVGLLILGYLLRPTTRAYFGKAKIIE